MALILGIVIKQINKLSLDNNTKNYIVLFKLSKLDLNGSCETPHHFGDVFFFLGSFRDLLSCQRKAKLYPISRVFVFFFQIQLNSILHFSINSLFALPAIVQPSINTLKKRMSEITAKDVVVEAKEVVVAETVSVSVEASVDELEVTETVTTTTTTTTTSSTTITTDEKVSRQLPIFNNPLIANAAFAKATAPQPKSGRVKAGNTSTTKQVSVLKITAAKNDESDVVVMRRMDSDLVHASAMYSAAYPAISGKMMAKEDKVIAETFKASAVVVDKNCGNTSLAGVW